MITAIGVRSLGSARRLASMAGSLVGRARYHAGRRTGKAGSHAGPLLGTAAVGRANDILSAAVDHDQGGCPSESGDRRDAVASVRGCSDRCEKQRTRLPEIFVNGWKRVAAAKQWFLRNYSTGSADIRMSSCCQSQCLLTNAHEGVSWLHL